MSEFYIEKIPQVMGCPLEGKRKYSVIYLRMCRICETMDMGAHLGCVGTPNDINVLDQSINIEDIIRFDWFPGRSWFFLSSQLFFRINLTVGWLCSWAKMTGILFFPYINDFLSEEECFHFTVAL